MGQVHDRVCRSLAAEVEGRTGWDEPPAVSFLYLEEGQPRLSQLDLPVEWWAGNRPPVVLDALSQCWGEFTGLLSAVAPGVLHGVAFRHETWVVKSAPGTPEHEQAVADAKARRIHQRRDRVECRTMWAVDKAGITYGAILARGARFARCQVSYPGPARKIEGDVPQALQRIVMSLLGVVIT